MLTNHAVTAVTTAPHETVLHTSGGEIRTQWVINAAGLGADTIDARRARFRTCALES